MNLASVGEEAGAFGGLARQARADLAAARTRHQYAEVPLCSGKPACGHHFAAVRRLLDRRDPGYFD